ncbi:MAG TPA: hypothetical protein VGI39_40295 [Polyangiaceae bacterium]
MGLASPGRAADPTNVREAEGRFRDGVRLMAAGKPDEARLRFAEANALVRSTDILWNLIAAESQSGHFADALNHARQFVRDPKAPANEVAETNVKTIPAAAARVGQIEVEAPTGTQIEIDSRDRAGHAPLLDPFAVAAGDHQVVAIVGSEREVRDVHVAAGETIRLAFWKPAPALTEAAELPLPDTREGTGASTPPRATKAAPTLAVALPTPVSEERPLEPASRARLWLTVGLGTGAVALGVTSGVFFSLAHSSREAATALQRSLPAGACPTAPGCALLRSNLHAQNDDFAAGAGLAVGAGVAAAGALVSWFLLAPRAERRSARALSVIPSVNPARPGLVVQGSF